MTDIKSLKNLTQNMSVLYVEDDVAILKSMSTYFEKLFDYVATAINGKEGLELYMKGKFDIVVTDLSMPIMNGIEMIEHIRDLDGEQSIIITTAHTDSDYMLSAIKDGVNGYVIKPFALPQLNHELFKVAQRITISRENEAYKLHLNEMVEHKTHELQDLVDYQSDNYEKTLSSMIEIIEQRDTYTAGHSKRVAEYSRSIADEMGYSEEDCTLIYQAGILHDVGKIGTPDAVLLNPKSLNKLEYKLIQGHVDISYKLLSSIPMFESLAEIVYSHHERYDGKGYPRALKADEITELGRIIIVADAFDAMTTNRIYKARKTVLQAIEEIESFSGSQFDPRVVKSAVIALKDTSIDESVNQLPSSKLEEERFAYFYKDTLSDAYNQNYLDVVLMKNVHERFFDFMYIVSLKNFSKYNKDHGWKEGDKLLISLGNELTSSFSNLYVFRVFGDDFVIMSEDDNTKKLIEEIVKSTLEKSDVLYEIHTVDLKHNEIGQISQIEQIQLK